MGASSDDNATITPFRALESAKSAASPMMAFAVFAALVDRMYPRRSFSYPDTDVRTAFAVAFERPGSHPTTVPTSVPMIVPFPIERALI